MADVPYVEPGDPRMASVPARVIWDVLNQAWDALTPDVTGPLVDALSQPTPTAEHDGHTVVVGPLLNDPFASPPSIADMVPGTTFTRTTDMWKVYRQGASSGRMMVEGPEGAIRYLDELDPSTIRDVTPPTSN